jgi:hypothetical protein
MKYSRILPNSGIFLFLKTEHSGSIKMHSFSIPKIFVKKYRDAGDAAIANVVAETEKCPGSIFEIR